MSRSRISFPVCHSCRSQIAEGQSLCSCGRPTGYMSFEERNRYELERWRAMQAGRV